MPWHVHQIRRMRGTRERRSSLTTEIMITSLVLHFLLLLQEEDLTIIDPDQDLGQDTDITILHLLLHHLLQLPLHHLLLLHQENLMDT